MQCPNCQNTVPNTANVCGYCGHRLKSSVPQASTPAEPPPSPKKKNQENRKELPSAEGIRAKPIWPYLITFIITTLLSIPALLGGFRFNNVGQILFFILPLLLTAFTAYGYWNAGRKVLAIAILIFLVWLHIEEGGFLWSVSTRILYPVDIVFYLVLLLWVIFDVIKMSQSAKTRGETR
jgi:hypothetical protein